MGQKSSKRQSYTPGTSQDAGLPTATVAENGGVKVGNSGGGANGQVLLLSSKETDSCDVITADVTSPSSSSAAASSPSAVTEKKKRRTPRFVFSRKRTGSGKRSKKNRKEANGVRPTSYPPATLSEETAGPQGTDRARKTQSMFVEEISEEVLQDVIPWPSDGGQPAPQAAAEGALKPSPPKKTSSDSTASTSRTHKDKKRNGSQKQKSPSKKKDKDSKKKSKKKNEAADKGKKEGDDKMPAEATVVAVVEEVVVPEVEKTQEQAFSLQAASLDRGKDNEDAEVTPGPGDVPAAESTVAEEPVKETVELTVAAVTESDVQLIFPEHATGDVEVEDVEEPAMTAEQLLAEIEQTILSKEEHRELRGEEEEETPGQVQAEETEETQPVHKGEAEVEEHETTQTVSEEEVELAGQIVHEDILELIDIPSPATEPTQEGRSDPREGPGEEEATETKTEMTFSVSDVTKDVMESGVMVEVQSSVEAVRQETSADTVQQQVENLMDSTEASLKTSEVHEELEATQTAATPEQSDEVSQSVAQSLEQDATRPEASAAAAAAAEEPTAEKPAEGAPSSAMTPAQLKALDKERKAAKKREDKERAKREKEEKKRLKEEKKREAKEKKKREKEEKEQKLREAKEAKERARASASMAIEVRPEEAAQEAAATSSTLAPIPAAGKAAEEVMAVSQAVTVESTPGLSVSADMFSQLEEDKQFVVQTMPEDKTDFVQQQPLPSTSTDSDDVHLNVDAADANLPAPFSTASIPPSTSSTSEADMDGQLLGSSVKEIITTIENNVTLEPKTYDEDHPPEIPDTPYPDEEDLVQPTSAVAQFSAAPDSPASSGPTSPESPEPPQAGSPAEPGSPSKSLFPLEVSETARSSVLRRIELGPRLRTAILRKSSSGAESEEKRVSLTKPRHVQVSDLTPPPRKPRSSRPLEHTRDSSGNYRYSSHGSLSSPDKDPEPVVVKELTVQVSSSKTSSSGQEAEGKEGTEGESGRAEVKEELTMVTSSVTESAQLPSFSSTTQNTEEKAADSAKDDGLQTNDRLMMEGFFSSGSESTQTAADCPALHAVTNIVLAGQTDPQHSAEQTDPQAPVSAENQSRSNDDLLQKVAAEVVQTVQKAAQEKASALDLPEEVVREVSEDAGQVKVTSEVSSVKCQDDDEAESVRANVEDCVHHSDKDDDSDCDAGLVQATVVCSAELVSNSSERATRPAAPLPTDCPTKDRQEPPSQPSCGAAADSDNSGKQSGTESSEPRGTDPQICQGAGDQTQAMTGSTINVVETTSPASEPGELGVVLVTQQTQSASSSAAAVESSFDLKVEGHDLAQESKEGYHEEEEEDSADTSQLQQFNKNYYDISVVLDDDEEDEDVTKTQSKSADSTPANNNLPEESSGDPHSSSEPSSSEKTSSPSSSQQPTGSSEPEQPPQAPQVSCHQLENGEGHVEEAQVSEQQERVKVTVRCNGSHVHNQDSAGDSIDSLLKLQGGLGEEKQVVLDTLEHNNNVSSDQKTAPERAESPAASGSTNDSRD